MIQMYIYTYIDIHATIHAYTYTYVILSIESIGDMSSYPTECVNEFTRKTQFVRLKKMKSHLSQPFTALTNIGGCLDKRVCRTIPQVHWLISRPLQNKKSENL